MSELKKSLNFLFDEYAIIFIVLLLLILVILVIETNDELDESSVLPDNFVLWNASCVKFGVVHRGDDSFVECVVVESTFLNVDGRRYLNYEKDNVNGFIDANISVSSLRID